ncbi:ABC transporter ATP-binding protein [Schlesneria paludicola]|uniref:ABC transporter ATP-binding protein n=1 Tax=Schlesneria paludicola TaxID=360056 RepID=UPI001ED958F3|nr:ABC transporter ATP-binding protein [Schlesneria paludicola]
MTAATPVSVKPSAINNDRAELTKVTRRDEDHLETRPLDFRLISRMIGYMRPYAAKRNWLLVAGALRAFQLPALSWVLASVIHGPIERGDVEGVVWGAIGFGLLAIFTQITMHFRQRLALEIGEAVVFDLRNAVFAHLQRMPMSYFHKTKVGRIISRMISDIEDVRVGVQEVMFVSLVALGQMLVAAACMVWLGKVLFLIVLGLAPILWGINRYFHSKLSNLLRQMRESFSRITATLAESVLGIRVTQGFVRQDENARMFGDLVTDHSRYNTAVQHAHGLFLPLLELNTQIFVALLLVIGGWRVLHGNSHTNVGDLVGFFFMANVFFSPLNILGNQYNQAMTAMAGAERLFELLDQEPEWKDASDAIDVGDVRGRVEFVNVTFGYDPERPVLKEISFKAEAGQTVALVGHTGSGKTSIVNLLAKYYLPQSGTILIDGRSLEQIRSESLHRHFGLVLQQNFLFQGTVAQNIRFSQPAATDDELKAVCRKLDCLDLIEELPRGFDTQVGERGTRLSLGQRQMICFARAMIADPRLLILDEATSSIDVKTEQRLQAALAELLRGRTSFVVAHRLSTIRHADLVLVLDHGRIIERGTHDELIEQSGHYARLFERFSRAAG